MSRKLPDLDQIAGFLAVAEELSFRRAAERLAIDQSALSRRIRGLEERIGFPLLFRTTHAVRLTDAGRQYYESSRSLVDTMGASIALARRLADGGAGSLRIAYMTFAAIELMPAAVRAYHAGFPNVTPVLTYQNTISQKMSLARGEIDVGLMLGPFEHTDFDSVTLASERLVAVISAEHPLAAQQKLTIDDIAPENLIIGTTEQWDFYRTTLSEIFAFRGHRMNIAFEAPSLFGILGLVRGKTGITLLPTVIERFCPTGLVTRRIVDAGAPVLTVAAWRRPPEGNVSEFIKVLRKVARDDRDRGQTDQNRQV